MTRRRWLAALLAASAGCTVGPDYEEPAVPAPPAFGNAAFDGVSADPVVVAWWTGFGDPGLDRLIDRVRERNLEVRAAAALLREARALRSLDVQLLAPVVTADGSYTRQLLPEVVAPGSRREEREFSYFNAGFDATWEIDLFGRVRRLVEAATAEAEAVEASRRDVLVSVLAETARSYFELRGARHQLEVARRNVGTLQETVDLTVARLDAGRGTELDVVRARAELETARSSLPPLETEIARARHRLAVLTAEPPSGFVMETGDPALLDALPALVAVGKPEDLLRRRPDIRVAERRLAAATARIGVAVADLFPRLSLDGTLGLQARTVSGLARPGALAYNGGPGIAWAAFALGQVAARIRASDARAEADLHAYEAAVLQALEETENALVRYGRERERRDALRAALASARRAVELARLRFQEGAADFLTVLDAQRTANDLESRVAESQTRTATALIALYKALGGGWEVEGGSR